MTNFCKGPGSKCLRLVGHVVSVITTQLGHHIMKAARHYINKPIVVFQYNFIYKSSQKKKKILKGTSRVVQWLRLHASTAGGTGQGTKIPHASQCGQKKKQPVNWICPTGLPPANPCYRGFSDGWNLNLLFLEVSG